MGEKKITINDVAKMAGVSKGTVDRVLHNRGEVSLESEKRVRAVVQELGYEPNLNASLLASRKETVIACLLPKGEKGEYWDMLIQGAEEGAPAVKDLNAKVEIFSYDQYRLDSFRSACAEMLETHPDGVIMTPLFKDETATLADQLQSASIPFMFVDSKLKEKDYLVYYGMPMRRSGVLCAHLLTEFQSQEEIKEVLIVRIQRDAEGQSDPTVNRRNGFIAYMAEHFPQTAIHNLFIKPNDDEWNRKALTEFFKEHPGVHHIVMFNSRIHLICNILKEISIERPHIIGYDDLEKNLKALREGLITMLITQHTCNQTKMAIEDMADYLVKRKVPSEGKDLFLHMDILTPMNVDFYNNSRN